MDPVTQTPAPQPNAAPPAQNTPQSTPQGASQGTNAPGGIPPFATPQPAPQPQQSAIEVAAAAARAQFGAPQPAQPSQPAPATVSSGEQPRNPDGTFAPIPRDEAALAAAAGANPDPNADPNAAPPDADPNAAATDEDAAAQALVVPLPPRRPGEAPLEIAAPDQETAEALRRMANGYQRAEQLRAERAQLDEARADVQTRMEAFESDPVAVLETLDPQSQLSIAQYLLTRPHLWAELAPLVQEFHDPRAFAAVQAQAEAERFRTREHLQTQAQYRTEARANAAQIRTAVQAMIPESVDDASATSLYTAFLNDVRQYAERNNLLRVDVDDLPAILARRCREHGIDPIEAADRMTAALSSGSTGNPSPTARPRVGSPAAGSPPQRPSVTRLTGNSNGAGKVAPKPVQRTGAQFVQSEQARRAVAATPPAGAGSPGAGLAVPPPNQSIEERLAWARQHLAASVAPPR